MQWELQPHFRTSPSLSLQPCCILDPFSEPWKNNTLSSIAFFPPRTTGAMPWCTWQGRVDTTTLFRVWSRQFHLSINIGHVCRRIIENIESHKEQSETVDSRPSPKNHCYLKCAFLRAALLCVFSQKHPSPLIQLSILPRFT